MRVRSLHIGLLVSLTLLVIGLCGLPRAAHADWDTVPALRVERALKMQPSYEEAEAEPYEETGEVAEEPFGEAQDEPYEFGDVERYLAAEGAYYTRTFSFASSSHGEYQAFLFGQVDKYGVLIRLDYLNQFASTAFGFEVGGDYYLHDDVRMGLNIRFAPDELLIERQGYTPFIEAGLLNRRVVARVLYQFRDF